MTESLVLHEQLMALNRKRLEAVMKRRHLGVMVDIHGFILGKDTPVENDRSLKVLTDMALKGAPFAVVTGYGDGIHSAFTIPLREKMLKRGIKPEDAPWWLSTRNGALTVHAGTGELVQGYPIDAAKYTKITTHPLIQAIQSLTPQEVVDELESAYEPSPIYTRARHPRQRENPALRHDWHEGTQAGYQLTAMYDPELIRSISQSDPGYKALLTITDFTGGTVPTTTVEMGALIQRVLEAEDIFISVQTAASHPEIDIIGPDIDKSLGAKAIVHELATRLNLSVDEVRSNMIGGGDSPTQNDKALLDYCGTGVTNTLHPAILGGMYDPVYLDFPAAKQIERTAIFLEGLQFF